MVELVDTVVLEATASASEFESRLGHQKIWSGSINGDAVDCKSAAFGTTGSIPVHSTNMEVWQSPVYCNSLENCRVERHREFKSHRFRQI